MLSSNRLSQRAKQSGGSDSILTAMFALIMYETGIENMKWNNLMTRYIKDPKNSIPSNNREQSSERGNLNKELLQKSKMTWKVFCKGMRLLNYTKFELVINVHHRDKITVHSKIIMLGPQCEDDDGDSSEHEQNEDVIVQPNEIDKQMGTL